jgi:hypothetical protein
VLPLIFRITTVISRVLNRYICNFCANGKISTHSSTPLHGYPTIRLPREFKAIISETARIYFSDEKDKLAFKFIIDKKVDKICTISENSDLEDRLSELESEIRDLKSPISKNENLADNCNKKGAQKVGSRRFERPTFAV